MKGKNGCPCSDPPTQTSSRTRVAQRQPDSPRQVVSAGERSSSFCEAVGFGGPSCLRVMDDLLDLNSPYVGRVVDRAVVDAPITTCRGPWGCFAGGGRVGLGGLAQTSSGPSESMEYPDRRPNPRHQRPHPGEIVIDPWPALPATTKRRLGPTSPRQVRDQQPRSSNHWIPAQARPAATSERGQLWEKGVHRLLTGRAATRPPPSLAASVP